MYRVRIASCLVFLLVLGATSTMAQVPGVEHVVVIGVDGLGPVGFEKAPTPNIDRLIAGGASTMHARGVMPTSSSPLVSDRTIAR